MKLFRKKITVQNDEWKFWTFYDKENHYGLNFLEASYMNIENQNGFEREYYLKILIPGNKLINGTFPLPETNLELQLLEDNLIAQLEKHKVNCKQVYRSICFGVKSMLFEVVSPQEFEKVVNEWKQKLRDYSLEIIEDKPWTIYNENQPDDYAWQQMGNRQVYNQLVSHGSIPEKDHLIEHAIQGNFSDLKILEEELQKEGGKTLSLENDLLEIAFESQLDLNAINGMTYFLMDKSKEYNCKYDGWSAAIVK